MSFIIGRGRYAKESYPQSPAAAGGGGVQLVTAWADGGPGGDIVATPNWTASLIVSDFTVHTSKTSVEITTLALNATVASHGFAMGVAAVPTGSPAPTTPDYAQVLPGPPPAFSLSAHQQGSDALIVVYGAGGDAPAALTIGDAYDFYALYQADAALAVVVGFQGSQMKVNDA